MKMAPQKMVFRKVLKMPPKHKNKLIISSTVSTVVSQQEPSWFEPSEWLGAFVYSNIFHVPVGFLVSSRVQQYEH